LQRVAEIAKVIGDEPMKWKLFLAHEIVGRYHGAEIADQEQDWFLQTFSARKAPTDIAEIHVEPGEQLASDLVLRFFGSQRSRGQVRRLFEQGAVSLNGQPLRQIDQLVEVHDRDVFRLGKRTWFRLRVDS
jgi:tyrosyl-tRNA synthetase